MLENSTRKGKFPTVIQSVVQGSILYQMPCTSRNDQWNPTETFTHYYSFLYLLFLIVNTQFELTERKYF